MALMAGTLGIPVYDPEVHAEVLVSMKLIGYWTATTLIGLKTLAGGVTDLAHGRESLVSGRFVFRRHLACTVPLCLGA
jgi:hypothetical protein